MWYFEAEALANEHRNDLLREVAQRRILAELPPHPRRNLIGLVWGTLARWRNAALILFGYTATSRRATTRLDMGRARRRYAASNRVARHGRLGVAYEASRTVPMRTGVTTSHGHERPSGRSDRS
jgi:hypothetical protein